VPLFPFDVYVTHAPEENPEEHKDVLPGCSGKYNEKFRFRFRERYRDDEGRRAGRDLRSTITLGKIVPYDPL